MALEIMRLRELIELQDARIAIQEIELDAYRNGCDGVQVMTWKAVDYEQQQLDDISHTRMVIQRVDGRREEHQHAVRGEGVGMTGVTIVAVIPP